MAVSLEISPHVYCNWLTTYMPVRGVGREDSDRSADVLRNTVTQILEVYPASLLPYSLRDVEMVLKRLPVRKAMALGGGSAMDAVVRTLDRAIGPFLSGDITVDGKESLMLVGYVQIKQAEQEVSRWMSKQRRRHVSCVEHEGRAIIAAPFASFFKTKY